MTLADLHIHSDNSPDGENSVIELCESAVAKKIDYIAITDHCEIDLFQKDRYETALRQSYFDMLKAQDIFDGQLGIIKGIELGNALDDIVLAEKVIEKRPYDFILGSLHHLSGIDDFAFIDLTKLDCHELIGHYFDELLKLAVWGGFDVLAHLTYPLRYINGAYKMGVDIKDYSEKIKKLFAALIERGKGLEINTSGLRQIYGLTMPDLWAIRLFHEMGGSIITFGSDAHSARDIGANISDALNIAKKSGFNDYCIFKERKPVYIKIQI